MLNKKVSTTRRVRMALTLLEHAINRKQKYIQLIWIPLKTEHWTLNMYECMMNVFRSFPIENQQNSNQSIFFCFIIIFFEVHSAIFHFMLFLSFKYWILILSNRLITLNCFSCYRNCYSSCSPFSLDDPFLQCYYVSFVLYVTWYPLRSLNFHTIFYLLRHSFVSFVFVYCSVFGSIPACVRSIGISMFDFTKKSAYELIASYHHFILYSHPGCSNH